MTAESVLLLDGSGASFPIRVALESIGYRVTTIGANGNQFQARMNQSHHSINYGDPDRLATFVSQNGFRLVIPGCTDVSFQSYASLDDAHRCFSRDAIQNLNRFVSKSELAVTLSHINLPLLDITLDEVMGRAVKEAIIVKPADAYSGLGITILQGSRWTQNELDTAISRAQSMSKDDRTIIQRYVEGDLFSLSLFSDGLKMLASPIVQEFVNSDLRVIFSHLASEEISQNKSVKQLVASIQEFLGKERWFLHLQFLLDPVTSDVYVIDCAARCPGDYYGVLVEMASHFPYFTSYVNVFRGEPLSEVVLPTIDPGIVRQTFHGFDATYGSGVDVSGLKMLEFYADLDWSGDLDGRVGVGFYRL
jgi:biotin carboxylase